MRVLILFSLLLPAEITSAVRQVASVALTFGNQYSSGELVFGAQ